MIHLIRVSDSLELMDDLKEIYIDSFPANERREWQEMLTLIPNPNYNLYNILDENKSIGMMSVWMFPEFTFIEHFAIHESNRGKGIGSQVIKLLLKESSSMIILEVDEPTSESARRRVVFYQRLGFYSCHQEYYQPPYSPSHNALKMQLMSYPRLLTQAEFITIKTQLYKDVYKWNNYTDFP